MSRSLSPPIRRLSTVSSPSTNGGIKGQEDLINAYEAEEERIINILSRKLEKLREEKISLENALEAESESHVNRLTRELTALKMSQQSSSRDSPVNGHSQASSLSPDPGVEIMLETLRKENDELRSRLADTERDYIRITRLNEIYLEELIEHRNRLGIPIDNLIGLPSSRLDPLSHARRMPVSSISPSSMRHIPQAVSIPHAAAVPIPRPPSQIHRPPPSDLSSEGNTPLSHSPSSSSSVLESPFPLSSSLSNAALSLNTNMTSLPSSSSFNNGAMFQPTPQQRALTYPSVPPPSLSSSFGSPTVPYHINNHYRDRDASMSPVGRRRESVERGARVAETGTLIPRSRAGSTAVPVTTERTEEATGLDTMELGNTD